MRTAALCLLLGVDACDDAPADATAPNAAPQANGIAAAQPAQLPEPTAPASWSATMGELSVNGVDVKDVSATVGPFRMMPVIQTLATATASCGAARNGTTLRANIVNGTVTAIGASGPGADCVKRAATTSYGSATIQFELTFAN